MKTFLLKKITAGILIVMIVCSTSGISLISFPKKVEAVFGIGDTTFDASNFFENVINVINTTATSFSEYSLEYKAFVLDTLATTLAKQLIRQITASVVNWINSGFEGSPSFITNPGSFFLDVADQISGEFLAKNGGPLTALCSPFSIDVRLALAFKYHPKIQQKYTCTIGAIIKNSKNAVAGANINGFTAGDFRQGGWPAFVSLTTEPQNNAYGAYLTADSELSLRVANAQVGKRDEISNGKGFLSWRDSSCLQQVKTNLKIRADAAADPGGESPNGQAALDALAANAGDTGGETPNSMLSPSDCPIKTPGSLIVSSLETSVNGPLHELELVDSINEIVNALAAALVTQVLQTGLSSVSGSGPSDSTSYINQIKGEANANSEQVNSLRNSFISSVEKYIGDTLQYKTNKDKSLNLILEAKRLYDSVKSCYGVKISSSQPPLDSSQIAQAQSKIAEIDSVENTKVSPIATRLLASAQEADNRYVTLIDIRNQANAATTVNDLNSPSTKFTQMLQSRSLTSPKDVADSQTELEDTTSLVAPLQGDAQRRLQECQIFPYWSNAQGRF